MKTALMFEEYRADVLECLHYGTACVVDRTGVTAGVGDTDWMSYYRSASKPIQALPTLLRGLHAKYGLSEEEAAIFSGSHCGDEDHVRALESVIAKTGLREEDMVMLPTYPGRAERRDVLLRANRPPRRIYHNCSGKHLCLMLLARDLGEPVADYWKPDSKAQKLVREMIAYMSDTPYDVIQVGMDGCGVPVFAVPFKSIAVSYLKMSCPELIGDEDVRGAVEANMARLHAFPNMIAGKNRIETIITSNPDLVAKSGAMGVFAVGVRSRGLAMVFKTVDGSHDEFADETIEAFRQLDIAPETVSAIRAYYPDYIVNDNGEIVGRRKPVFDLRQVRP